MEVRPEDMEARLKTMRAARRLPRNKHDSKLCAMREGFRKIRSQWVARIPDSLCLMTGGCLRSVPDPVEEEDPLKFEEA